MLSCTYRPKKRLKRALDDGENPLPPRPTAEVNADPQVLGSPSETRDTVMADDEGADKEGDGDGDSSGGNSDSDRDEDQGAITDEG